MSVIATTTQIWGTSRERTLATLDEISKLPNAQEVLGWRPGPGRAHIAWQLTHIGITEELFATERLLGTAPSFPDLVPRFKGGSRPDDDIPSVAEIREVLETGRRDLLNTLATFNDGDLSTIPERFRERGWTLGRILHIITWHEAHHQGQAHITLNLWKAAHA